MIEEGTLCKTIHVEAADRRNIQTDLAILKNVFLGELLLFESSERTNSITTIQIIF